MRAEARVVVYTDAGCRASGRLKQWLAERRIPFEERDVSASARAARELADGLGLAATPVIVVDGVVQIGYHPGRLARLLAAWRRARAIR